MTSTQLLSSLVMRTLRKPLPALAADDKYAVLRNAVALWGAYDTLLRMGPWPDLSAAAASTAITDHKLSRSALSDPLHVVVYDREPIPENQYDLSVIRQTGRDSSYLYFDNGSTDPVWVRTWPQPPVFVPTGDDDMEVGVEEGVIYEHTTRKFYRLKPGKSTSTLVSTYATAADWEADPEIWGEAQSYLMAAAQRDQLGNMEQERGQARELERLMKEEETRLYNTFLLHFAGSITT